MSANENSLNTFASLHDQMMALALQATKESSAEACRIALGLLSHAELPLKIRVRAHIVLGCGDGNYLWHAEEAVNTVEWGMSIYAPSEGDAALMEEAQKCLRSAQRDHQEYEEMKARWRAEGIEVDEGDDPDPEVELTMYGGDDEPSEREVTTPLTATPATTGAAANDTAGNTAENDARRRSRG